MAGILYTVATPIGNLEDMSPRAIKTLENVDYILCEDTRVSSKLLSHFEIKSKLVAYHKFNEKEQLEKIVFDLEAGKNIALISDAGTPCVSDPGRVLVNELTNRNIKITPISGACAVSTFLAAAPKSSEEYAFTGFIPRQNSEQEKFFNKYKNIDVIFYDSPNRLLKTIENIEKFRGKNATICVGRELTKIYEEIRFATVSQIKTHYTNNPPKGEIIVMLYKSESENKSEIDIDSKIKTLMDKGFSAKDVSVILSSLFDINKNSIYRKITQK